jgi:hypothetical protein
MTHRPKLFGRLVLFLITQPLLWRDLTPARVSQK